MRSDQLDLFKIWDGAASIRGSETLAVNLKNPLSQKEESKWCGSLFRDHVGKGDIYMKGRYKCCDAVYGG